MLTSNTFVLSVPVRACAAIIFNSVSHSMSTRAYTRSLGAYKRDAVLHAFTRLQNLWERNNEICCDNSNEILFFLDLQLVTEHCFYATSCRNSSNASRDCIRSMSHTNTKLQDVTVSKSGKLRRCMCCLWRAPKCPLPVCVRIVCLSIACKPA